MPSPEIKICGLRDAAALEAAIKARADFVGLVFAEASPRFVTLQQARELAGRSGQRIGRVGLFVDADDATIGLAAAAARLDAIQLHGEEDPARVARVRAQFGLPVWKALPVASASDVERAVRYVGTADRILFDAKPPPGADRTGGLGLTFDWSLLAGWKNAMPWGLAGGLTPGNVADAVAQTRAPLVDSSSGVESAKGVKDVDKIAAFCKAARS